MFDPSALKEVPETARRHLDHVIAPKTPLSSAVRLSMHGTIKLRKWLPFTAEQVINWPHGFVWNAKVSQAGLPIVGYDRMVDGEAAMRWRILGLIPVMAASGPDIVRSAAGRLAAETVWLPSTLCRKDVLLMSRDASTFSCGVAVAGESVECVESIDDDGRLRSVMLKRWADPDGKGFRFVDFGGYADDERTFEGFTIPTRLRIGYFFGSDRFEFEGEFIRIIVDSATYI